jgi:hypothetical protein
MTAYKFNKQLTRPKNKKRATQPNLSIFYNFLLYATFLILKNNCPYYNNPRKILVKDILKTLLRLLL